MTNFSHSYLVKFDGVVSNFMTEFHEVQQFVIDLASEGHKSAIVQRFTKKPCRRNGFVSTLTGEKKLQAFQDTDGEWLMREVK